MAPDQADTFEDFIDTLVAKLAALRITYNKSNDLEPLLRVETGGDDPSLLRVADPRFPTLIYNAADNPYRSTRSALGIAAVYRRSVFKSPATNPSRASEHLRRERYTRSVTLHAHKRGDDGCASPGRPRLDTSAVSSTNGARLKQVKEHHAAKG